MRVKAQMHGKALNIRELRQDNGQEADWMDVSEVIEVAVAEYNHFRQGLLVERDWLKGVYKSGKVVAVKSKNGKECIAVDTSGYGYARYAGIVLEVQI